MPTKQPSPAEWMELVVAYAERLRKTGVTRMELDGRGCKLDFAPHVDPDVKAGRDDGDDDEGPVDVWSDPATFGIRNGGRVPGFSRLRDPDPEDDE